MTESAAQETVAATPVKTPKKKATAPKAKSAPKKAAASHPPTAQMVNNAIKNLKERGGSSLQAIKKYIAGTYKVDADKLAPFIKKYLKGAVDGGKLVRTKGKGASGSFKLASTDAKKSEKKAKPKVAKKPKTSVKPKKPKAEGAAATAPKKPKPKAKKPKASKPKPAVGPKKSPSKVKKAVKSPAAKKPKSPKPKKAAPKKAAKKPAAKK